MPRARHPRAAVAGFSAVELCLLLSVVGIGAAAFVPTFVRQLRVSKIAEAATVLEDIEKRLHSYHQTERLRRGRSCLPDAAGPTPAQPHAEPVQVDFQRAGRPGAAVWRALGVQPAWPVRYRYSLQSAAPGCVPLPAARGQQVEIKAEGDLDGDGQYSSFLRRCRVDRQGRLRPARIMHVERRIE